MADGPSRALQAAVVTALKANAPVALRVGTRVYDEPPQAVEFPYVRIGLIERLPQRFSGCAADHDMAFGIEVYSRPGSGRIECAQIAELVVAALDEQEGSVTVAGFGLDMLFFQTMTVSRAGDGRSYEGRIAFTAALSNP